MRRPTAYTLVEVLLVLVLLVLAAGLVAPAVMQGGDRAELEDAAEKLATMWSRARLDAITSGQTLVFRCVPGATEATVSGLDAMLGAAGEPDPTDAQAPSAAPTQELSLTGVMVATIAVAEPPGSPPVLHQMSASSGPCMLVFRSDGVTSDAEATLQHETGLQLRVTLRGLTGATRVVEADPSEGGA